MRVRGHFTTSWRSAPGSSNIANFFDAIRETER
jgi:hypothetical protein